jgi:c-di-GMP-binding flagellar brake protein YcgR
MVNLSAGGLCAVVQTHHPGLLHTCDRLFLEFRLPDAPDDFMLLAHVRHVRQTSRRGGTLIGLKFEDGIDRPLEPMTQSIAQFVTREERRQLRRKR